MVLVDSYSESNQDSDLTLSAGAIVGASQSFSGDGTDLHSAVFYLKKLGAPTGNVTCKLYAHSGTFGTDSIPTGAALATAPVLDISTLTTTYALTTFTFGTTYTMVSGTKYCIALEYSGGDASNNVKVGVDVSAPTHGGNDARLVGAAWSALGGDLCFYIYSESPNFLPFFKI